MNETLSSGGAPARKPKSLDRFDRAAMQKAVVRPIRLGQTPWQPDILEVLLQGQTLVWKDAGRRPWPFRPVLGSVLRREAGALRAVAGLASAPRLVGLVGNDGFVMEKVEAVRLPHLADNDLDAAFFDALLEALRAMHALGVTHGDLRRTNVLIEPGPPRRPRLIDFGTSVVLGRDPGPLRKALFRRARRIDLLHFARIKAHYLPGQLSGEEEGWLADEPWYYRAGHLWRSRVYRPLKWRNLRKTLRSLGLFRPKGQ